MPCDTAIAGISINMSLAASCRLDIDDSSAEYLVSNYSPNIDYNVTVMDFEDNVMQMPFTDENIGETYKVMLTGGVDCPDNIGWSYLTLEDKIAPQLTCKEDTMTCVEFFFYTSQPMIECDLDTIEVISMDFEPACDPEISGISTIATRTYRATDKSGNSSQCTEKIFIRRITYDDINFPQDLELSCDTLADVTDVDGNLLPPSLLLGTGSGTLMDQYIFGVPTGSGTGTGSGVSLFGGNFRECRTRAYYEDTKLTPNSSCEQSYMRMWTVYEWYCDGEEEEYRRPQLITFRDTTPPSFTFVEDTLYYDLSATCDVEGLFSDIQLTGISDNCTDNDDLKISYEYYPQIVGTGTDSTFYIQGVDTIRVEVTITDNCQKKATKNVTIITRDKTAPTAICIGFIEVALTEAGVASVPISSFNSNSYDGCGSPFTLSAQKMGETEFHEDYVSFSCDDPDTVWVVFNMEDAEGNTDQCMVEVEIKKDKANCPDPLMATSTMSGYVKYEDDLPVANAKVRVSGTNKMTVTTDAAGYYEVNDYEVDQTISIMPEKDDNPEQGITTLDIIYLQRHMLGLQDLNSAYQVIAADIDANDDINAFDLLELRRMVIGDIIDFSNSPSYVFIPSDMYFEDEMDPWMNGEIFGKEITTKSGENIIDFMGIKVGDVNNSLHNPEVRSANSVEFEYEIIEMGRYLELNVYAPTDMSLEGFQTTLQYDEEALQLMKVGKGQINIDKDNYTDKFTDQGSIPISWSHYLAEEVTADRAIMRFTFEKLYEGDHQFSFGSRPTKSELYTLGEIFSLNLKARQDLDVSEFTLLQNVPNPWQSETSLKFTIPLASDVELNVYDAAMRTIYNDAQHFEAGVNEFKMNYSDLPQTGIFIYEIIYGDQVRVSKMTKL